MDTVSKRLDMLRQKIDRIESFFEDNTVPYYAEIIKLQIQEKIKKDRMDLVVSLTEYDETQQEILSDKIDIFSIFYDCVAELGLSLYKQIPLLQDRCH